MKTHKQNKITASIGLLNLDEAPECCLQNVRDILLHCPNCTRVNELGEKANEIRILGLFESRYLIIECVDCNEEWCLCTECGPKQRVRIQTTKQLKDHRTNMHSDASKKRRREATQTELASPATTELASPTKTAALQSTESENTEPIVCDMEMNSDTEDNNVIIGDNADSDGEENASINLLDVVNSNNLGFAEKKNAAYFEQCYLGRSDDAGIKYLVMRSTRRSELEATEYCSEQLPDGHAELQVRIANLAFVLTRGQCHSLVQVLDGSYKVGCENGFASASRLIDVEIDKLIEEGRWATELKLLKEKLKVKYCHDLVDRPAHAWSTRIPSEWNDVRNMYLEGARSIVVNLPIPTVHKDVPGHSYVSVADCIRHFLAHRDLSDLATIPSNLNEMTLEKVAHSSCSERAREILQPTAHMLTSYLLFWSDDVEPNRTKANRGSVWLLTATIATHLNNGHSLANTFPIAVGRKGDNHDAVIAKVEEEMKVLRSGSCPSFYIGKKKKKVKMAFEQFCFLQDQPERRDFNLMRAGNGATTGRFGVSADHYALYRRNVLPSCRACLEKMEKALSENNCPWPMDPCDECVRWDVLDDPNELAFWVAPKDYPATEKVVEKTDFEGTKEVHRRCLRPFRITYESLKEAIDTAHDGYLNKGWSNQNCVSYLEVEGMSSKFINVVLEHSARSLSLQIAKQEPHKYQAILDAAAANPSEYKKAPNPNSWTRPTIPLVLHPDVIMHLIFLGIVKTTNIIIQSCLSAQTKWKSFKRSTETYLKEFQIMTIEWIPIQPYQGGKMGGWVSENFLGFSRIMPWFYQNIDAAVAGTNDFVPPVNLPQNKWLNYHNKYWLQVRGLDSKGTAAELKERVAQFIDSGEAPEPMKAPEIPPADVEAVLLALKEILQCIMSTTVTPALVNRTRYAVRVFLSKYDSLCRPLRQKTPAVLSSYNFICLLNLPDIMEKFGPLRCLWEGGPRGEGFVRFAKPLMNYGFRINWHYQLMTKMLRAGTFDTLLNSHPDPSVVGINDKNALRDRKGSFHLYKSAFDVEQRFLAERPLVERVPVSVVLVEESTGVKVFSVVRDYSHLLQLKLNDLEPMQHFGLNYYSFAVSSDDGADIAWERVAPNAKRLGFALLLPLLNVADTENRFALISSNWLDLSPSVSISELL